MGDNKKQYTIPLLFQEREGINRKNLPIRIGIPFPKGLLSKKDNLYLKDPTGLYHSVQLSPLAYWNDQTIQWGLLQFNISLQSFTTESWNLEISSNKLLINSNTEDSLSITRVPNGYKVITGAATFYISKSSFPFESVLINQTELLSSNTASGLNFIDAKGESNKTIITDLEVKEHGCNSIKILAVGFWTDHSNDPTARFDAQLEFFKGLSTVSMDLRIHNPRAALHPGGIWELGDPGSVYFKELSITIKGKDDLKSISWSDNIKDEAQHCNEDSLTIYQDSSGGENWNSINHINKDGQLTVSFQGYKVFSSQDKLLKSGVRAIPYIQMNTESGWIAGSVKEFWQNFPTSLSIVKNQLKIGLFPENCKSIFELQGGEQKRHTILLDFGLNDNQATILPQFLAPLSVLITPEWIEESGVIRYFVPAKNDSNKKYLEYIQNVIDGKHSFFAKREIIDEYGWRNFGDIFADHEAVHAYDKSKFISHYNNQFDVVYGAGINFLRTQDSRWHELMYHYAKHVIDIDIYHTNRDKPAYNHGQFWHTDHYRPAGRSTHRTYSSDNLSPQQLKFYGGGPSNENNYSSGLLLYYYLTGDSHAKEAILELAEWVLDMDDGSQTLWAIIDDGPTGLASQTVSPDFHGPGRGAGNSINTLLDAYKLTNQRKYLDKAEEILERCIHPNDDIEALNLNDPEYRWSYLVFLQILGKYLDFKKELGETDWHFYYARDSLLHYANWMVDNEVPYKDVLHKVEIPTETWPAQDVRKAVVLNEASKYAPTKLKARFRKKARFFFDRCLEDLLSFETAYLTRPMVLLMVYGIVQSYFDNTPLEKLPNYNTHNYDFGEPAQFIPQRARLKRTLIKKLRGSLKAFHYILNTRLLMLKSRLLN